MCIALMCSLAFSAVCQTNSHNLSSLASADTESMATDTFTVIKAVLQKYRDDLQWSEKCSLSADERAGTIETTWHPVHKGEVERKVQVLLSGNTYKIDVWHRSSWGLFRK